MGMIKGCNDKCLWLLIIVVLVIIIVNWNGTTPVVGGGTGNKAVRVAQQAAKRTPPVPKPLTQKNVRVVKVVNKAVAAEGAREVAQA